MSLFDVLEGVDKFMNAMDEKDYSRLLGLLSMMIHKFSQVNDENKYDVQIDQHNVSDEEKAIMRVFVDNKNLRPGILATLYSRVISTNFKVNYSRGEYYV